MLADPIAGLRSPSGALMSLYVDRPTPGGLPALLADLLRPVRDAAEFSDRVVQKSVRSDSERIHDLADQLEFDSAPAYAIFASDVDELFVLKSLTHGVPNVSALGPRPYLRPLRAAPRTFRAGVIVADRAQARVFLSSGGLVDEIEEPLDADIGKQNFGGFAGYAEQRVRARAEEATGRMWKEAGWRLLDVHQDHPLDYLAIGGHEEMVDEISRVLHPYLARLYRATFAASPQNLSPAVLRAEMTELDRVVSRGRQSALAGRVCDTAWSGGQAVLGLTATLEACNVQAVETLVVAGPFAMPGVICNQCGHLARTGETCPICSSKLFEVEDVVAALMDATVEAGGRVSQLEVASPLDLEGVGALTRFPFNG